eukprot:NODE_762_length_4433_cov_0.172127.p1 type:complete len:384 gc:universal NODE_762_length_4433_cov_0.172127:969-2120(+)
MNMMLTQPSEATMVSGNPPLLPTTNKRKNEEFHELFDGDESELVEDFSCALQKDILVHGRVYISHSSACFYSNILGWTTSVMIKFTDLVKVEKRNSAFVLPNALMLYTSQHKKHFLASFVFRDLAYNILVSMWRNAVPNVLVGNEISYLEDQSDFSLGLSSCNSAEFDSVSESENTLPNNRPRSENDLLTPSHTLLPSVSNPDLSNASATNNRVNNDISIPVIPNGPVKNPCDLENVIFETKFSNCTVNLLWNLLYSDEAYAENGFSHLFHINNKKVFDWVVTSKWSNDEKPSRKVEYIMPLTNPLGPKQVKTFVEETIEEKDLSNHLHLTHKTLTPYLFINIEMCPPVLASPQWLRFALLRPAQIQFYLEYRLRLYGQRHHL